MNRILPFFFSFKKRDQNNPQCLKTPFSRLLFCEYFRNGLIHTHRTQCAVSVCDEFLGFRI